jgi:hypothetical protein
VACAVLAPARGLRRALRKGLLVPFPANAVHVCRLPALQEHRALSGAFGIEPKVVRVRRAPGPAEQLRQHGVVDHEVYVGPAQARLERVRGVEERRERVRRQAVRVLVDVALAGVGFEHEGRGEPVAPDARRAWCMGMGNVEIKEPGSNTCLGQ